MAAFAGVAMLPGGAAWSAGWSKAVQLTGTSFYYDVSIDAAGDSVAAWDQYASRSNFNLPVYARAKSASGLWQSAQLVPPSTNQAASSLNTSSPKVHIANSGVATVVYQNDLGVWTADRLPGQAWQQAKQITSSTADGAIFRCRFNTVGDGVIAWEATPGNGALYVTQRRGGGNWGAPVLIAMPQQPGAGDTIGGVQPRDAALAEDGSAVVAFEYFDVMHHELVNYRFAAGSTALIGSGDWSVSPALLGPGGPHGGLAAASGNGHAAVVGLEGRLLAFAHIGAGSKWSSGIAIGPQTASYLPSSEFTITFAADNAGHASLLSIDSSTNTLTLTDGNMASSSWSAPIAISMAGQVQPNDPFYRGYSLAVAPDGFTTVAWWTTTPSQNAYAVTRTGAGNALSPPAFLARTVPVYPGIDVAVGAGQKAVVAWSYYNQAQTYQAISASTFSR